MNQEQEVEAMHTIGMDTVMVNRKTVRTLAIELLGQGAVGDEANNGLIHEPGVISMAKTSSPNTGGSQFFIVPEDSTPSHLDGQHTVFGKVSSGLSSVTAISDVETGDNDRPIFEVRLLSVDIS